MVCSVPADGGEGEGHCLSVCVVVLRLVMCLQEKAPPDQVHVIPASLLSHWGSFTGGSLVGLASHVSPPPPPSLSLSLSLSPPLSLSLVSHLAVEPRTQTCHLSLPPHPLPLSPSLSPQLQTPPTVM